VPDNGPTAALMYTPRTRKASTVDKSILQVARKRIGALALSIATAHLAASCGPAPQERRYIFVDGGAHIGESYLAFQKTDLYSQFQWEVFAIEANPHLADRLPHVPRLTVIDKAIWVSDGTLEFFMESETSGANSLFEKQFDKNNPTMAPTSIEVESFDFSQWLKSNFTERDYIILSLDIEGAEYPVLDKMFEDGTMKYLDRLYIELHSWLLEEERPNLRGFLLMRKAKALGITVGGDSVENAIENGEWTDSLQEPASS